MDNDSRVQLRVLGISYSQLQSGAYALIMAQVNGPYRIPIVVGAAEAQAIAIAIEGIQPPRPMTHDLLLKITDACGVKLRQVFIYKFENGVFSSELTFSDGDKTFTVDSRTSDAVALAMRTSAPIWTTLEIISETGFIIEETTAHLKRDDTNSDTQSDTSHSDENLSIDQLQELLNKMVDEENYEEAARITKLIEQRKQKNS